MGFFLIIQTPRGRQRVDAEFSSYDDAERYMTGLLKNGGAIVQDYEIIRNPNSRNPKFKLVAPWKTNRRWNAWEGKWEQ